VMPSSLPVLRPDQPETDALCLIQSFYAMMLNLADRLDIDVDRPRNLQKITRTT
jgi:glutamine---fructose-6-phosphate transaminase (isomerizing)